MNGSLYFDCESGCRFNEALSAFTMSYGDVNLLTSVPPCDNGVCRLVGDIDTARLFLPLPNDIRVLDFSECKYLSKIEFEMCGVDTGLPKTSIVLPKGGRSVLSVVVDWDIAITEVGFPRYGGNTLAFIGDGWIRAESLLSRN